MAEEPVQVERGTKFPWAIMGVILTIVALGLIAYYFFH